MSSGSINVDGASLAAGAQAAKAAEDEVINHIKRLDAAVDEIRQHWQGRAANAFHGVMERYRDDITKLTGALREISDLLEKSANMHMANEDSQLDLINKFVAGLG